MSDPFVAEIKIFAGNFAPRSYAFCNGQLLPIAQNTALFSLVGTTYGGDGRTTLGLPNLQGRAPMHPGRGPGLTPRLLGEKTGTQTVTLTSNQLPSHTHGSDLACSTDDASASVPSAGAYPAPAADDVYGTPGATVAMASDSLAPTGEGQPHNNLQPYLTLNFIIALIGLYPSRS